MGTSPFENLPVKLPSRIPPFQITIFPRRNILTTPSPPKKNFPGKSLLYASFEKNVINFPFPKYILDG